MRSPVLLVPALALLTLAQPAAADPDGPPASPPPIPQPVALAPTAPAPPPIDETRALRFTSGVSLTGIGLTAVILGSVIGVRALVSKNDIGAHCDAAGTCDLTGYTYGSQAQDLARFSTICFGAGLGMAAAGVGLLLSAKPWKPGIWPGSSSATAWIAPARSGVVLGARW
jgi:hypothetical protein